MFNYLLKKEKIQVFKSLLKNTTATSVHGKQKQSIAAIMSLTFLKASGFPGSVAVGCAASEWASDPSPVT